LQLAILLGEQVISTSIKEKKKKLEKDKMLGKISKLKKNI
jgi:hypothetical protein